MRITRKKMKPGFIWIFFLILITGSSCGRREAVVVMADPWLADFAKESLEKYKAGEPGFRYTLKILSSETLIAHLRYRYPADLVFYADERFEERIPGSETGRRNLILGNDRVVRFRLKDSGPLPWKNDCSAWPPSGTALRRHTEKLSQTDTLPVPSCRIYPEFQALLREFLARSWVKEGYAFSRLGGEIPGLEKIAEGPEIVGLYGLVDTRSGRNPEDANRFFRFLEVEKSSPLFVKYGLHD